VLDSLGWNDSNRKFVPFADFGRCGGIREMIGPRINMNFPERSKATRSGDPAAGENAARDRTRRRYCDGQDEQRRIEHRDGRRQTHSRASDVLIRLIFAVFRCRGQYNESAPQAGWN